MEKNKKMMVIDDVFVVNEDICWDSFLDEWIKAEDNQEGDPICFARGQFLKYIGRGFSTLKEGEMVDKFVPTEQTDYWDYTHFYPEEVDEWLKRIDEYAFKVSRRRRRDG